MNTIPGRSTVHPSSPTHDEIYSIISSSARVDAPVEIRKNLTLEERKIIGKNIRQEHHRTALGEYHPRHETSIALDILAEQEKDRVQTLLPLRHERMLASPFAFYRGSAAIMAYDLGRHPNTGIITQLCGDAHLLNFGLFAAPDRITIFDINDFDETHPGPFEWDVHRLLTSLILAGEDRKIEHHLIHDAVKHAAHQYLTSLHHYSELPNAEMWYTRTTVHDLDNYVHRHNVPDLVTAVNAMIEESEKKDMWSAIEKFTESTPEGRIFRDQPPVLDRIPLDHGLRESVAEIFEQYKVTLPEHRQRLLDKYQTIDIGHKVVGVGSVGLLAFVSLLQGRDESDLLVLQSKQAVASVLEPYTQPSQYSQHGHRVVAGQQIMQSASDVFLGWCTGHSGREYYLRQLRDKKGSLNLDTLTPQVLKAYGSLCADTLARAHAKTGDPVILSSYLGTSDTATTAFTQHAYAYRNQVHSDYKAYHKSQGE